MWVVPSGPCQHPSSPQGLGALACLVLLGLVGALSCPGFALCDLCRSLAPVVWVVPLGPCQHRGGPISLGALACLVLVWLVGARSCPGVRPEVWRCIRRMLKASNGFQAPLDVRASLIGVMYTFPLLYQTSWLDHRSKVFSGGQAPAVKVHHHAKSLATGEIRNGHLHIKRESWGALVG